LKKKKRTPKLLPFCRPRYGYASKGTSVVLFRSKALRKHMYFAYPEWTGGLYVTPTIAGSRPGGLTASCWASLASIGHEGFVERTRAILECVKSIADGVRSIPGLYLLGDPPAMVVCFGSREVDVLAVSDLMATKRFGWSLNALQNPSCVHLCVTLRTLGKEAQFLADLAVSLEEVARPSQPPELSTICPSP